MYKYKMKVSVKLKESCILCGENNYSKVIEGHDRICPVDGIFYVYRCNVCDLYVTEPGLSMQQMAPHYGPAYPIYDKNTINRIRKIAEKAKKSAGIKQWLNNLLAKSLFNNLVAPSILTRLKEILLAPLRFKLTSVLPFKDEPGMVLDIGCGSGAFLLGAYKQGWKCFGVDTSSDVTLPLINNGIADIQVCFFDDAIYEQGFFDIVNMSHVLEHLPDPLVALEKVNRITKPGGMLIVSIPCVSAETIFLGSYWIGWDLPRHLYHFNKHSIAKVLEKAGFDVIECRDDAIPNDLIWGLKFYAMERGLLSNIIKTMNVNNLFWRILFWPLAFLFFLVKQSGRIVVIAQKVK